MNPPIQRRQALLGLGGLALACQPLSLLAQTSGYPSRPIKVIMPWQPGAGETCWSGR